MPEGDTIHRIAQALGPRLVGCQLERVTTQGLERSVAGKRVTSVAAHGKHLVIELDDGGYVRIHLGMYGRFRAYDRAAGDAALARMSPGRATLAVVTRDAVLIWIGARAVEISARRAPMRGRAIAALGPDVLADDFDSDEAARRAGAHAARTIGDVLLDQRIAAGIGNIYKCEALFASGVDPRTAVREIDDTKLATIYAHARALMLANLGSSPRTTRQQLSGEPSRDGRYFVYARGGKPCARCGSRIDCYQLGDPPRWTWSCPRCQPRHE